MRIRRTAVPAALAAFALVLAGCTGSEETLEQEDSPLNEYFGALTGMNLSTEELQRKAEEEQKKQQNSIAECMSEAGFEYVPTVGGITVSSSDEVVYEPDSKEWVSQWGYGAVNSPYDGAAATSEEPVTEDPNQEYVESLSESERTAYYETLNGPDPSEDDLNEDGSYEMSLEDMGCYGAAYMENSATSAVYSGEFDDLIEKMSALSEEAQNDPALAALDKEWSSCMSDAGHGGFAKQGDAVQSIYDKINAFWEENSDENSSSTDEESPEFKELGEEEIALALVDLDCREKTDYRNEALKIQFALEEKFIEQNKAELEKFKAAAEQGQ